jgi:hypothetical protein
MENYPANCLERIAVNQFQPGKYDPPRGHQYDCKNSLRGIKEQAERMHYRIPFLQVEYLGLTTGTQGNILRKYQNEICLKK